MSFPGLTIIGERLNPGFASSRRLLEARDLAGLQELARSQVAQGAAWLNINAGRQAETEPGFMVELVKAVQSVVSVPLSLDSPCPRVQAAVLAAYDPARSAGRPPLINSVAESRWEILALRRSTRARILFMASERLEDGQPVANRSPEDIHRTARRMVERARSEHPDLDFDDCVVDVSVGPMASDTENLTRTAVEAIRRIGSDPSLAGVHLSVGLSNLGIMLPRHQVEGLPLGLALESAFLTTCVPLGLDLALATPGRDYRLLPDGHPALQAFQAFLAADGYEALRGLRKLYRGTTTVVDQARSIA